MSAQVEWLWGPPTCPPHLAALRERVSAFAASPDLAALREAARAEGLYGLALPGRYGGLGLPLREWAHIAEVEGEHGPYVFGSAALLDLAVLPEDDPVREDVARGLLTTCNAMTEPDAPGSDPSFTTTKAYRDTDGTWRVTGRKWFVSGADRADLAYVLARTGDGLSLLLSEAFQTERELAVLGAGGQWEVTFDDAPARLLGAEGEGLRLIGRRVRLGRVLRCLNWLGQAQHAFTLMRDRARARPSRAGRLADFQLVQQMVFESLLAIRQCRPLVYDAAALLAGGRDAATEIGLAKVAAARMLSQVADAAVQVHGAAGLGPDTPLPAIFRTGRTARILDGPDELHVASVARRLLR
ncbi:acyl-CoA dehydrogenase family protein [Acrocarpospora phusangensis]|nr:acyl-CoA dehydrogenase [Acrocarpospora phusangensis]